MPKKGKKSFKASVKRNSPRKISPGEYNRRERAAEAETRLVRVELALRLLQNYTRRLYKALVVQFPKKDWSLEEE